MEVCGTEKYDISGFGYTDNVCYWDQFSVGFGLFVGFVDNKEKYRI